MLVRPQMEKYLHFKVQCSAVPVPVHLPLQDLEGWFLNIVIEKNEKARVMIGGLFAVRVGTRVSNTQIQLSKLRNIISVSPGLQWEQLLLATLETCYTWRGSGRCSPAGYQPGDQVCPLQTPLSRYVPGVCHGSPTP